MRFPGGIFLHLTRRQWFSSVRPMTPAQDKDMTIMQDHSSNGLLSRCLLGIALAFLTSGCGHFRNIRDGVMDCPRHLKDLRDDVVDCGGYLRDVRDDVMDSGYVKNLRDDVMDCGTVAIGGVPPVTRVKDRMATTGLLPPCAGAYLQISDVAHLGAIRKKTTDVEWDRRGAGVMLDQRTKLGMGPLHHVSIRQIPVKANEYKHPDGLMKGWQEHMDSLIDPRIGVGAKTLIYKPKRARIWLWKRKLSVTCETLPFMPNGWQNWSQASLEIGVPDPLFTHAAVYARVGFDLAEVADLLFSIVGLDLFGDAAYTRSGILKYLPKEDVPAAPAPPPPAESPATK